MLLHFIKKFTYTDRRENYPFFVTMRLRLFFENWIDQDKTLTGSGAIYSLRHDKPAKKIGLNEYLFL